jgi:predicted porin
MHKTVIAFAIAGLAAAPAFADSNVTLYGVVDYGYMIRNGDSGLEKHCTGPTSAANAGCPKSEFASGISVPSRFGFKGAEDLGNGTKAIFELEAGFVADNGTNSLPQGSPGVPGGAVPNSGPVFRRHSWVGLTGDWGTVLGGRVDGARYGVAGRYDPFEHGGVANMASLQIHASRADNAIAYVTPNVEGLYAVLAYTSSLIGQESAYNNGDARLWVIQPNYVQGPLSVTLNYEHATLHNNPAGVKVNIYVAGASYDFGVAKITGYYEHVKIDANTELCVATPTGGSIAGTFGPGCGYDDESSFMLGTVVPVTENDKIRASYVDYNDRSPAKDSCRKWGIGGVHFLSKRTNFYIDYAQITQRDNGHCTISPTPTAATQDAGGGSNEVGVGTRGYDLGIVHRF